MKPFTFIITIISVISGIASVLSIFFETPKILITLKRFFLILSAICFFFLGISILINFIENDDDNNEEPYMSTNEEIESDLNDENDISSDKDKFNDIDNDNVDGGSIFDVASIVSNAYTVEPIKPSSLEIPAINILQFSGEILAEDQANDYEFTPQISGVYRFEFSNVPNGTDLRLILLNSGGEELRRLNDLDNGDGLTYTLVSGETYYIRVGQYREFGSYTLNVGTKKEIKDITNYTEVSDSIQYTDQENDYLFVAGVEGTYRFEFSNVPNGTDLRLTLLNSGLEELKKLNDLDNGDGMTYKLMPGETYYIRVIQYREVGPYTLNIGMKKEVVDITNYTEVSDSIQYTDQQNDYLFVANVEGVHRFEFSNVPNGTDLSLRLFNSGWEALKELYDLDNGDGLTYSLTAGETYYIEVQQYKKLGSYTLNVGHKKEIVNITNYTEVSDNIQYTDQQNDYLLEAKATGTYRIRFSDIMDGNNLRLIIYNSGWEEIESRYDIVTGDVVKIPLLNGELYYIRILQSDGMCNYKFKIEVQNE